jgi:hypothetical protein
MLVDCIRLFTGYDGLKKESVTVKPSDHGAQLDKWLVHADAVLSRMWQFFLALKFLIISF